MASPNYLSKRLPNKTRRGVRPRRLVLEQLEQRRLLTYDLAGYEIWIPSPIPWGGTFQAEDCSVKNYGNQTVTTDFTQKFYLSNNQTWGDADDVYLDQYVHTASVPAGSSGPQFNVTLKLPSTPPRMYFGSGSFYIGMKTDANGEVTESNEANNGPGVGRTYDWEAFDAPLAADLAGGELYAPSTISWGEAFVLDDCTVYNHGTQVVSASFVQKFYLSNNQTWGDADDQYLDAYVHSGSIAAHSFGTPFDVTLQLPGTPPAGFVGTGPFYIGMKTDANNSIVECNESNNGPGYEYRYDWDDFNTPADTTSPTASIAAVSPDPRNTAVSTVTVNFSENVSGVDIGDFALTRDGTVVSLSGVTVTAVSAAQYTFDLTAKTATQGVYVLTLNGSGTGIADLAGNALAAGTIRTWTTDTTAPDVTLSAASPAKTGSPSVTVATTDTASAVRNGQVRLDVDLNNDGDYGDAGEPAYITATLSNGTVTFNVSPALAQGAYRLRARLTDEVGNEGFSADRAILVDMAAPSSAITFPVAGAYNNATWTAAISGTASDTGGAGVSLVQVSLQRTSDGKFWGGSAFDQSVEFFVNATGIEDWALAFPAANLTSDTGYVVHAKATDVAGNPQSASVTATFTYDATQPTLAAVIPPDDGTGVALNADLVMTFSENVRVGSGNIVLKKSSDNSVAEVIPTTSEYVTVSGATVTIDPSRTFAGNTGYYITMPNGAFEDLVANQFAGISTTATWNFTTSAATPPTVSTLSPTDNATGVPLSTDLVIAFNETVQKGQGNVVIKRLSDYSTIETIDVAGSQVTISGATAIIDPLNPLADSTSYYVQVASGAFLDLEETEFAGIGGTTTWNFATIDQTAPTAGTLSPVDNATGVGLSTDFVLTFSEAIQKGTAGNVVIKNSSDHSTVETIAVSSSRVTISGSQATIDPATNLAETTGYYVQVDAGAFKDVAGNPYAGINDATTWNVTTGEFTPPAVTGVTAVPLVISDADVGAAKFAVTVQFNEAMDQSVIPSLVFSPSTGATLSWNAAQSTWTDAHTYLAKYDVADANVQATGVTVDVTGARDVAGNPQLDYLPAAEFDIAMPNLTVSVSVSPASVGENGATNLVYTFTRDGATSGELNVNFQVAGGAAFTTDYTQTGAASFTATAGTVTIPDGATSATVVVDPASDTTVESDETVVLTVASGAGYSVGSPAAATGTIVNDDGAALMFSFNIPGVGIVTPDSRISLGRNTTVDVTVSVQASPEAVGGYQLSFANSDVATGELSLHDWAGNAAFLPVDAALSTPADAFVSAGAIAALNVPVPLGSFKLTTPNVTTTAVFELTTERITGNELYDTVISNAAGNAVPVVNFGSIQVEVQADTIPPQVTAAVWNTAQVDPADVPKGAQPTHWAQQRSSIRDITVVFSEPVSAVTPSDLVLTNLGLNAAADPDTVIALRADQLAMTEGDTKLVISLGASDLPDGVYQLRVLPSVRDHATNLLDGDQDGVPGDAFVLTGNATNKFHKLKADWNGSGGVNIQDFATFAYWFQAASPPAPTYVDLNGSGGINIQDFSGFAANFQKSVAFPASLAKTEGTPGSLRGGGAMGVQGAGVQTILDLLPGGGTITEEQGETIVTVGPGTVIPFTARLIDAAAMVQGFQLNFSSTAAQVGLTNWTTNAAAFGFPVDSSLQNDLFVSGVTLAGISVPPITAIGSFSATAPFAAGDYSLTVNFASGNELFDTMISDMAGNLLSIDDFGDVIIRVADPNTLPTASDQTVTIVEDTAHVLSTADFHFADADPGDVLSAVRGTTLENHGSLQRNDGTSWQDVVLNQEVPRADLDAGRLRFVPTSQENGVSYATFGFRVKDTGGPALSAQEYAFTVNVTAVNDAPAGTNRTVSTAQDTAYVLGSADFGFTDPNDVPANTFQRVKITTLPTAGTLKLNGSALSEGDFVSAADIAVGKLLFQPANGASGSPYASFTFQVEDNGGTANGGVDLDPTANTWTINVTAAAQISIDVGDHYLLPNTPGQIVSIYVHGASEVQGVQLNVQIADGYPEVPGSTTDGPDITGVDLIGSGTVFGSAPSGNTGNSFPWQYSQIWIGGTTVAEDSDPETTVTVPAEGLLAYITISTVGWDAGSGPWTLLLKDTFNGDTNFQMPDRPGIATITNGRLLLNAPPLASADSFNAEEDRLLTVAAPGVLANDSDAENQLCTATLVTPAAHGTVTLHADGSFEYQPALNYHGDDAFTYKIWDGLAYSGPATVTLHVSSVNDAPAGTDRTATMPEDGVFIFATVDFALTDRSDTPANALLNVKLTTLPLVGTLSVSGVPVSADALVSAGDIQAGRLAFRPADNAHGLAYASFTFQVQDDGGTTRGGADTDPSPNTFSIDVTAVGDVSGRYLFYNNSSFDGNDAAATSADYNAIAPAPSILGHGHAPAVNELTKELGKQALLPGQTASFVNYSSYIKGINGILLAFDDLVDPAALSAADFQFRVGNDNAPATWAAAPAPAAIRVDQNVVHPNFPGSPDVVTITWADENPYTKGRDPGAISNQWIEVTVLAGANTGLAVNDVFYFGNQVGESGNSVLDTNVDQNDEVGARNHPHSMFNQATTADPYDFNHDRKVDQNDEIFARNNAASAFTRIVLLAAPSLLQAHGTPSSACLAGQQIDSPILAPIVAEATWRWQATGLDAAQVRTFQQAQFVVASFRGTTLGETSASTKTVYLDADAAGFGWFVDRTPGQDEEFLPATASEAAGKIDLLSAVMHEMGHLLGKPDLDAATDELMAGALQAGLRRNPAIGMQQALDAVFAGEGEQDGSS